MSPFGWICYLPLVTLLLLLLCGVQAEIQQSDTVTTVYVRYNEENNTFSATGDVSFGILAATVIVNNSFSTTGWDVVHVRADEAFIHLHGLDNYTQRQLAYRAMGYGEGYATQKQLEATLYNNFLGADGIAALMKEAPVLVEWIDTHLAFMESRVKKNNDDDIDTDNDNDDNDNDDNETYGQELQQLLALMDGMVLGYNDRLPHGENKLNRSWLFYLNFQAEMGDVLTAKLSSTALQQLRERMPRFLTDLHCSALVKVVKNDIFFSHVTWNSFNSMLRQYKTYRVGSRFVTMSTYPGFIHSLDDWYMTHARLAVMETTIGVSNSSLIKEYISPETVSEFLRVMIANFLAESSPGWVHIFSRYNSGTYNNQWMILNMANVYNESGLLLPSDTFWVAEQLPGNTYPVGITAADMSAHLNRYGYWASYNLPYFENVYSLSGTGKMKEMYGDFFSYTECPRAKMFARNHSDVKNLESMKGVMRYNNYKMDPLSLIPNCTGAGLDNHTCNPAFSSMLTIASRGDLNPKGDEKNYGPLFKYVGHRDHGATDVKIASWSGMINEDADTFIAHVICGPTNDQQPTFEWSDDLFDPMPPLYGIPKVYNFPFMTFTTYAPRPHSDEPTDDEDVCNEWIGIGVAAGAATLVIAAIGILFYRADKENKERRRVVEADALLSN
ncbi:lysosomal/endosomal membrane protein p67 [Trypanosoma theileri]|uniref:Phospholipase B-like n=1 Tax=Trypanosoma theileri TaxID=67003 RepID=A0A1X0NTZ7_9TRYP|nr:lysosomal/endosomal membrane protein p67 [Trypanosoma theileri]ORC88091.1 lysosomal/endosomal membrane protein p67 [Trypanosoma theileri]